MKASTIANFIAYYKGNNLDKDLAAAITEDRQLRKRIDDLNERRQDMERLFRYEFLELAKELADLRVKCPHREQTWHPTTFGDGQIAGHHTCDSCGEQLP
jgi:hypothetical protein